MSGLDKILSRIIADAQAKADQVLMEASDTAASILAADTADANSQAKKRIAAASLDAQASVERSRSTAALNTKRFLLQERNRIIDEALSGVKESICSLPDPDYFLMLTTFILSHSQNEAGKIVLNKKDLSRVPAGFAESLSARIAAPLTISEKPGDFDAGCVLVYGDIEYNGTLSALINEKKDELRDLLNKELFAE